MENKKTYQYPNMKVVSINSQNQLLAGSMTVSSDAIGTDDAVLGRENSFWDDDE